MAVLITLGNLNQYTFANSIVAASCKVNELFEESLTKIEVFHSRESLDTLQSIKLNKNDNKNEISWTNHLENNGISERIIVHRTIEVTSTQDSVEEFVGAIESIVSDVNEKGQNLLLDLTNGTTLSKNLLSTAAYILDIPHQYMIDVSILFKITKEKGFLEPEILLRSYVPAPDSTHLDNISYLSLSEILRYKRIIENHAIKYISIDQETADTKFFSGNLEESIRLKLKGDRRRDNTIYRIAASSISDSAEDLISRLIDKFILENSARTFGEKLGVLRTQVEKNAPSSFDIEFFRKFNDFILYLRNSSTHKGRLLTDLERFKADLAVKMAFPFIEFYTDIIYTILADETTTKPRQIKNLLEASPEPGKKMYYGLDGDNTGQILEELFFSAKNENHFKKVSQSISKAIARIRNSIIAKAGKNSIVFEAGDDLLFTGDFSRDELESMQGIYSSETSGLTCSVGYGNSFQEVYLALKRAKTHPGKNSIVGIKLE
jgi:hypothetical protein